MLLDARAPRRGVRTFDRYVMSVPHGCMTQLAGILRVFCSDPEGRAPDRWKTGLYVALDLSRTEPGM